MQTIKINYRITPSQLDDFQAFIDSDTDYERFWGHSDNPSITFEEYSAQREKRLIDQINRCPKEPIPEADRGSAFNEVVDMIIHRRSTPSIESLVESHKADEYYSAPYIDCSYNGFRFIFDAQLCKDVASLFPDALSQYLCGATLPTKHGDVRLYGYIDEWVKDRIYDIKTTAKYDFGKYERKWQRHLYPYCITEEFSDANIKEFEFTVVKFNKSLPTNGEIFSEVYTYNHEQSKIALREIAEQFIEWLESRRELITDKKIFGGENADDYMGVPIDIETLNTI